MSGRLGRDLASPLLLVVAFIGAELLLTVLGIVLLALLDKDVPQVLGTVCVGAMTGLAGLLAPNTGLLAGGRTAHNATLAGNAAAAAVMETDELRKLQRVADELADELADKRDNHNERKRP